MQTESDEQDLHLTRYSGNIFGCGEQVQDQLCKIYSGYSSKKSLKSVVGDRVIQKYKVGFFGHVYNNYHYYYTHLWVSFPGQPG